MFNDSGRPKVSVIIATYNRDGSVYLARSTAFLAQTYTDFELIIVDDRSSDDIQEVIRTFTDPRIRVIRHEANRGAAAARNTGISEARGEYIAFLDDDDECMPNRLADQVLCLGRKPRLSEWCTAG